MLVGLKIWGCMKHLGIYTNTQGNSMYWFAHMAQRWFYSWLTLWTRRNIRQNHGYWRMILGSSDFKGSLKVASKPLTTCSWCLAKNFLLSPLVLGMHHMSLSHYEILFPLSTWGLFCSQEIQFQTTVLGHCDSHMATTVFVVCGVISTSCTLNMWWCKIWSMTCSNVSHSHEY